MKSQSHLWRSVRPESRGRCSAFRAARLLPVVLCAPFTVLAFAGPPTLTVKHTSPRAPGDILRIDATAEGATSCEWQVWTKLKPAGSSQAQIAALIQAIEDQGLTVTDNRVAREHRHHMTFDGGFTAILPSWAGQEWLAFVCVANDQGEQASTLVHVVVPGKPDEGDEDNCPDPPPPNPDDGVPVPVGEYGVARPLYKAGLRVQAGDRQVVALKIAAAMAAAAASGTTGQQMVDRFASLLAAELTATQKQQWSGWRTEYVAQLERLKPLIPNNDVQQWKQAFVEMGIGMAFVR